jgi:2-polyprenyl-3-methyl-5-hydroxy-6-metoxy-1,4-benzoquinol methylase
MTNPYRIFYNRQSSWHQERSLGSLEARHTLRANYYEWYTKGWLPPDKNSFILDIGTGTGQFIYFLNRLGYTNSIGIDLDKESVELAKALGLKAELALAHDYLKNYSQSLDLIVMLDIIEHFTLEELFEIMELAYEALVPGGTIIVSVPNAISPTGLSTRFSDITHENCFSPDTLSQMFFCHNMKVQAFRDPWPAPVSIRHSLFRMLVLTSRKVEAVRLKLLGLSAPKYWSPVLWAIAEKV